MVLTKNPTLISYFLNNPFYLNIFNYSVMKLRQEFIPNTKKKFSIREDGKVIRHYTLNKFRKKVYRDHIVPVHDVKGSMRVLLIYPGTGRRIPKNVAKLVLSLILNEGYKKHHVGYLDGDHTNLIASNLFYIMPQDQATAWRKHYYKSLKHCPKRKEYMRQWYRRHSEEVTEVYARMILWNTYRWTDISDEILACKTEQLKLRRDATTT